MNKCPQSCWCNGWRPEVHVLKGHTSGWALNSIQWWPELHPLLPSLSDGPTPSKQASCLAECGLPFFCSLSSPEQHAVQELTKAAMSGVGIDGEVLSYLELAQVCNNLLLTFKCVQPVHLMLIKHSTVASV